MRCRDQCYLWGSPLRVDRVLNPMPSMMIGEVEGHIIIHTGSDGSGHHYLLKSPGTLDDYVRAAFLNIQPDHLAQTELARALARVQLELLTAPEMRSHRQPEPPVAPQTTQTISVTSIA